MKLAHHEELQRRWRNRIRQKNGRVKNKTITPPIDRDSFVTIFVHSWSNMKNFRHRLHVWFLFLQPTITSMLDIYQVRSSNREWSTNFDECTTLSDLEGVGWEHAQNSHSQGSEWFDMDEHGLILYASLTLFETQKWDVIGAMHV